MTIRNSSDLPSFPRDKSPQSARLHLPSKVVGVFQRLMDELKACTYYSSPSEVVARKAIKMLAWNSAMDTCAEIRSKYPEIDAVIERVFSCLPKGKTIAEVNDETLVYTIDRCLALYTIEETEDSESTASLPSSADSQDSNVTDESTLTTIDAAIESSPRNHRHFYSSLITVFETLRSELLECREYASSPIETLIWKDRSWQAASEALENIRERFPENPEELDRIFQYLPESVTYLKDVSLDEMLTAVEMTLADWKKLKNS